MAIEDGQRRLVEVNPAFCRALRASEEDLLGIDLALLIPAATWTLSGGGRLEAIGAAPVDPERTKVHLVQRGDGTVGRVWLDKSVSAGPDGGRWVLWSLVEVPELSGGPAHDGAGIALQQSDLIDALPYPVVVLDADRSIVAMSAGFREAMGAIACTRRTLATLGGDGWQRLDDELARLPHAAGLTHWTLDLPWRDGQPARIRIDAHRLSASDGSSRLVVQLCETDPADAAAQDRRAQRERAVQSETYRSVVDGLVSLAGAITARAPRAPRAPQGDREPLNAAARILALSAVFEMHARQPERLPLAMILRAVVSNRAHLHAVDIAFSPPLPAMAGTAPAACLREQDAALIALAADELVGNALAHGSPGTPPTIRLSETSEYAVFHVRNGLLGPLPVATAEIEPDTSGLGLVKALLPSDAHLMMVQSDDHLVASVLLQPPLLRFG